MCVNDVKDEALPKGARIEDDDPGGCEEVFSAVLVLSCLSLQA